MKIAITGGRDHHVTPEELATFWRLFISHGGTKLHHGNAPGRRRLTAVVDNGIIINREIEYGVDRFVAEWAQKQGVKVISHPVSLLDWETHGKIAGFIRNMKMLSCVDLLIAFPGGRGTRNCVQRAKLMKVKTVFVAK